MAVANSKRMRLDIESVWLILFLLPTQFCYAEDSEKKSKISFTEVSRRTALQFQHISPPTVDRHLHLTMGSGLAWLDYDRDGSVDLLCAQGAEWDAKATRSIKHSSDFLFRNLQPSFQEVSSHSGLQNFEYGMGFAVGDQNNDGFPDLYITNFGANKFYLNNGDGTFSEVINSAPLNDAGYSAGCTWTDINSDGNLDLYLSNYVLIDSADYPICNEKTRQGRQLAATCPPWHFSAKPDRLFQNSGDGSLSEVSEKMGLTVVPPLQGLGVLTADFDHDDDMDIYVANDSVPNHFWVNDGQGKLTEDGLISGTSLNRSGQREAGMGVATGDVNGDGLLDIFVTNYFGETNTLYRNEGFGFFLDVTDEFGLAAPSRTRLGFGALLLDADNDADLDLFVTNGHVHDRLKELGRDIPYEQPPQVFEFGQNRFSDVSATAGAFFSEEHVGRGCASADYNRDGMIDFAVLHLNGPLALLQNQSRNKMLSISFRLVGTKSNRDGIGAYVKLKAGPLDITRHREGSSSYLSCNDELIHFGLKKQNSVDSVTVHWLGEQEQSWDNLKAGSCYLLIEGQSTAIEVLR